MGGVHFFLFVEKSKAESQKSKSLSEDGPRPDAFSPRRAIKIHSLEPGF
jgi:hypothetical protein